MLLFLPSKSEQEMLERGDCEKPTPQQVHQRKSCKSLEDKVMHDLLQVVLSCPPELEQEHGKHCCTGQSPLPSLQPDQCKNITWGIGFFPRTPVTQPEFGILSRGFGVSGSSRTSFMPCVRRRSHADEVVVFSVGGGWS